MKAWHGHFVWYELMTSELDAALGFYEKVMGWTRKSWDGAGEPYHMFALGKKTVAGAMTLPAGAPAPPHWMGYIGCDNVDETAAKAKALGGSVHLGPQDIPNIGRFAVIQDPQGVWLALFTPGAGSPDSAPGDAAIGEFSWRELATNDVDAGLRFYGELFGWEKKETHDMGGGMIYQIYGTKDRVLGGAYKLPGDAQAPPHWGYYTRVADIDATVGTVKELSGTVLHGPMQVPGGDRIATCKDPQGAVFSLQS